MHCPKPWIQRPALLSRDTSPEPEQNGLRHSMRAAIWFLLPSDGTFSCSSTSLQYFLTRQGWLVVLRGGDVSPPPWERYLNWCMIPPLLLKRSRQKGPPSSPKRSRQAGPPSLLKRSWQGNLPPSEGPRKLPRKIGPLETRRHHVHHSSQTGSQPGTIRRPGQ